MKKNLKFFLMGASAVIAGFFAYALLKDRPEDAEDDIITEPAADTTSPKASGEHHISQEFIEHRREFYWKRAAERAASPTISEDSQPSFAVPLEDSTPTNPVKEADGQGVPMQEPKKSLSPEPNDETSTDFLNDEDHTFVADDEIISAEADKGGSVAEWSVESENQEESEEEH